MPRVRLDAPAAPAPVSLAGLAWVRTQLHVRLCAAPGVVDAAGLLDPARFRLVRAEGNGRPRGSGTVMPPTGHAVDGEALVIRFNVMSGPGQRPLASGRWILSAGGPDADPSPVRLAPVETTPLEAPRTFALPRGREYVAAPRLDAATGELVVEVQAPRARPAGSRRHRLTKTATRTGLRLLARVARAVPRGPRRRVLFVSSRPVLTGNVRVVYERMVERGLGGQLDLQRQLTAPGRLGLPRRLLRRLRMLWRVARADVILVENSRHQVLYQLDFAPGVRFIQLWHAAGAFKTVKLSRVGKRGGPDPYARNHRNYTHAIVSSELERPFYAEAFGIPEERVVATGIPRQDVFFDERTRAQGLAAARRAFPATEGRFTILFAPTYRGSALQARYDLDRLDYPALHALCVEKDAVCIVRMHPAVQHPIGIPNELRDRLLEKPVVPIDVRDLMFAVDLLVTDYSSILFDFALLRRPMLFYAYDLEAYVGARDFYEPYETFVPGRIVRTFDELLDAIRRDDTEAHKVDAFVASHAAQADGRATDRVIDQLILPA